MIIGKFKTNHPFMFGLLIIIAVVLWMDGFMFFNQSVLPENNAAPLYGVIAVFFNQYRFLSVLLAFLFMLLQAFMFNRVIAEKNLVDRNSWLPALIYIVLMSSSFNLFGLQPIWFANFFLIIALDKLFKIFKDDSSNIEIFNIGLFVSVASLFYLPVLSFIILIIIALIIYFLVSIKEILASIIGLVLPYLFVVLYFYWWDRLDEKIELFPTFSMDIDSLTMQIVPYGWVSIGLIGFIALVSTMRIYLGTIRDKPIRIRLRYQIILAYLIVSLLSVFLAGPLLSIHYGIIMLPLAAIIAGFFQENKRAFINELFFSLLILLMLLGKLARLD